MGLTLDFSWFSVKGFIEKTHDYGREYSQHIECEAIIFLWKA
jgi:hypothetical protein